MSERVPQLSIRAIVLSAILAAILAAANAYLGLFAGLTIATAIPAAVVSMAILRLLGGGTILENNIVQTGASAGSSIAAGVIFTIPEQDVPAVVTQVRAGRHPKVDAVARDQTSVLATGALTTIDNEIDQTTGTVKLKATFPNEDLKLWPGKFVNARLVLKTQKHATIVPASVVQRGPQGTYAYVIKPDKTVGMQTVTVGPTEDGQTVIESGLTPGQQVVVDGQYKLQPGSHVELTSGAGQPSKPAGASAERSPRGKSRHPTKS